MSFHLSCACCLPASSRASSLSARLERSRWAKDLASRSISGMSSPSTLVRSLRKFSKLLLRVKYQARLSCSCSVREEVIGRDCKTYSSSPTNVHSTSWGDPNTSSAWRASRNTLDTSSSLSGGCACCSAESVCKRVVSGPVTTCFFRSAGK